MALVSVLDGVHVLYHSLNLPSLNITATICVGHHVVILFRHSAYDGSWSVTADVAGPIGTINKYTAAMAGCVSALLHKRTLNQIV